MDDPVGFINTCAMLDKSLGNLWKCIILCIIIGNLIEVTEDIAQYDIFAVNLCVLGMNDLQKIFRLILNTSSSVKNMDFESNTSSWECH